MVGERAGAGIMLSWIAPGGAVKKYYLNPMSQNRYAIFRV